MPIPLTVITPLPLRLYPYPPSLLPKPLLSLLVHGVVFILASGAVGRPMAVSSACKALILYSAACASGYAFACVGDAGFCGGHVAGVVGYLGGAAAEGGGDHEVAILILLHLHYSLFSISSLRVLNKRINPLMIYLRNISKLSKQLRQIILMHMRSQPCDMYLSIINLRLYSISVDSLFQLAEHFPTFLLQHKHSLFNLLQFIL